MELFLRGLSQVSNIYSDAVQVVVVVFLTDSFFYNRGFCVVDGNYGGRTDDAY